MRSRGSKQTANERERLITEKVNKQDGQTDQLLINRPKDSQLTFHGSEAAFKTVPQNEIALFGNDVEFQCSTDLSEPLSWSVTYASETTSNVLYIYGNLTYFGEMLCRIDTNIRGQYNLIVNSVEIYHAGKYKCSEGSFGTEVEADLAVIDPEPFCYQFGDTSVVETGHLVLECKLWFAGEVDSFTKWSKNGRVVDPAMVQMSIYSFTIKSTLRQQVNSSDNDAEIIFKTTFRQRNNSRETVVTRNFTVSVIYGPKNINIEPKSLTYNIGDSLKCSADGNPNPSYEWALIGNETGAERVTDGPVLIIDKTMITDIQLHFQCTAINNVTGERKNISKSITFTITGTSETSENVRERRNTLSASDVDHLPHEETSARHQSSQQDQVIGHSLETESNYAELDKPSTVHQQDIYSQLHIYGNASAHAEYCTNQSDIELEQISPDYLDIDSVDHLQPI